ncbi:ABC-three component system protein [Brevundimonas sp.]|uniref:ABC-three component system protein n=1 Tax=Brevundimonas sp. TaxID=1871086 RepID=UPI0017E87712|nr:ABC-three component system protein [Brevundimonas sp.]MBA4806888.1 hypothetical protein [Brevundimonas sp.]
MIDALLSVPISARLAQRLPDPYAVVTVTLSGKPREHGAMMTSLAIRLSELDDGQLEEFVEIWVERRESKYTQVERIGGPNDKARDVIGFYTADRHEGAWDLFQCKRKTLGSKLGRKEALLELGKMFHHHVKGAYATLPLKFTFVSPRGIVGPLMDLLNNPSTLKAALLAEWDSICKTKITASADVPLTAELRAAIAGYDFNRVTGLTAPLIVKDEHARPALVQILKELPGHAPQGEAPDVIANDETEYLGQLRAVYGEAAGTDFPDNAAVLADATYGDQLRDQRTRYFEAEAFKRFHRDNTDKALVVQFQNDVYHGVIDVHREPADTLLDRLGKVMKHAAGLNTSIAGRLARIPVVQGICHHLANDRRLKWTK